MFNGKVRNFRTLLEDRSHKPSPPKRANLSYQVQSKEVQTDVPRKRTKLWTTKPKGTPSLLVLCVQCSDSKVLMLLDPHCFLSLIDPKSLELLSQDNFGSPSLLGAFIGSAESHIAKRDGLLISAVKRLLSKTLDLLKAKKPNDDAKCLIESSVILTRQLSNSSTKLDQSTFELFLEALNPTFQVCVVCTLVGKF